MKKYLLMLFALFAITVNMQAQEVPKDEPDVNIEVAVDMPQIVATVTDAEAQAVYNKTYHDLLDIAEVIVQKAKEKESLKEVNWWEVFGETWTYIIGLLGVFMAFLRVPTKYSNIIIRIISLLLNALFKDVKKGGGQHNKLE